MAAVTVVIPTWNRLDLVERCLRALMCQERPADEVIVVDNGSVDGTASTLRDRWPTVVLMQLPENQGFAGGVNRGIEAATPGNDIVLLNNDASPRVSWLAELCRGAAVGEPEIGVFASKILDSEGVRIDSTGDFMNKAGVPVPRGRGEIDRGQFDDETDVLSACAGASYFRRAVLDELGGFDEDFFAYFEDLDFCLRARSLGWRVQYVPTAVVRHDVGATSASIPGFSRYHSLRNLWFLLVKNVPLPVLVTMLPGVLAVQAGRTWRGIREGHGVLVCRAHRDALQALPAMLRKRRVIQTGSRLSATYFRSLLMDSYRPGAPRLD